MKYDYWQRCEIDFQFLNVYCELVSCWTKELVIVCCEICDVVLCTSDRSVLVISLYRTLLLDKGALKTIASPSHRATVLADTCSIAYRTIGFLRCCPNPTQDCCYRHQFMSRTPSWQNRRVLSRRRRTVNYKSATFVSSLPFCTWVLYV